MHMGIPYWSYACEVTPSFPVNGEIQEEPRTPLPVLRDKQMYDTLTRLEKRSMTFMKSGYVLRFTFTVRTPVPVLVYGVFFFSNRTWLHVARVSTYSCVFAPGFVEKRGLLKCFWHLSEGTSSLRDVGFEGIWITRTTVSLSVLSGTVPRVKFHKQLQ